MRRPSIVVLSSLALLCVAGSAPAGADEIRAYTPGPGAVPDAWHGSSHEQHKSDEGYLERWMFTVDRHDGGWMQLQWMLTNLGPGDGHAGTDIMRIGHDVGKPDTPLSFYRWAQKAPSDGWKASAAGLDLKVGQSWLKRTPTGYAGYLTAWGYELEFTVRTTVDAWRPGSGSVEFPDGGRFRIHLMPAGGVFEGRERTHRGEWLPVRGRAWGDHATSSMLPHHIAERWLRLHGRAGPYTLSYLELFTPERWGEQRFGWLVVMKGDAVVASSLRARATPTRLQREPGAPHHRVPVRYRIEAPLTGGGGTAVVEVRLGKLLHREDVLEPVPRLIRSVLEMFVQPVNFFHRARFELRLPGVEQPLQGRRAVSMFSPFRAPRPSRPNR